MWRKKKFIIAAVVAGMLLIGALGGVAYAQSGSSSAGATGNSTTLFDKVAAILNGENVNVTSAQLQSAFQQAGTEMRTDAMNARIDAMVQSGKITQDQADQLKSWLQSKPDVPGVPGIGGWFGGRSEMPRMGGFGMRGHHQPGTNPPATSSQ